jgi:hypothetical protein
VTPPFGLSRWQVGLLVFLVTLCVTPFAYDSTLLRHLHRAAWLGLVPAYGVGLAGTAVALGLTARFPGESALGYAPRVLGPAAGRAYLVLLGLVLLAGAPANLHVLTRVVRFTELPRTSTYVSAFVFTGVVGLGCYFGPEVFARVGEVLAALIAAGLVVIYFAPLPNAVPDRLLPLAGFAWPHYLIPPVSSSMGTARGFLCLLVLGGTLREPRGAAPYAYAALTVAWALLALSLALPVAVLGSGLSEQLRYPILGITGTVSFRWFPFQRLTVVTVLVWQMVMYVVLAFYLWSGTYVLASACGSRRWRTWLLPAGAAAAYLGAVRLGPAATQVGVDVWNFSVVGVGVAAPALLWLTAALRGRRGRGKAARAA